MLDLTVIFFFPSVLSCGLNVKLRGSWEVLHFSRKFSVLFLLCCFRTRGLEVKRWWPKNVLILGLYQLPAEGGGRGRAVRRLQLLGRQSPAEG